MMERQDETPRSEGVILVVDDDTPFRQRLMRALIARGFNVSAAGDRDEAIALAQKSRIDLALVDLRLGSQSGLDLLRDLKAVDEHMLIVILTGYGSIATAVKAVQVGAADYLTKPVDIDQIVDCRQRLKAGIEVKRVGVNTPSLDEVQWDHIQRVLADCGGNISKAADALGLHRRSLQRKLSKRPFRTSQ